jgi:ElaB/YqjD/DUF883 family membrane-anchored ribosome-binding protein
MSKQTRALSNDMGQLVDDARALVHATADMAGDKIGEIRKRLASTLDQETRFYGHIYDRAVNGTKAANGLVHDHPYQAIAIGMGLGAILGFLLGRPYICNKR